MPDGPILKPTNQPMARNGLRVLEAGLLARNGSSVFQLRLWPLGRICAFVHNESRSEKTRALLLLKLLIDHLSVVSKRSLIFRILSEVGIFLHVYLADGILFLHAAPVESANLSEQII